MVIVMGEEVDVFELARRYHGELKIEEPSLATLAAELFDDLGLKIREFLEGEGYSLTGAKFIDYDKSLVLSMMKGDRTYEIILRKT
ncbi:hypothetical protein A3L09_04715 [Thermococcus profundus]|uniref:Uncharacterized protein n=1 Tax=Thermococcus profundus TaxID=49899 RepID=A0A2Z2M828_THEPR|nr:hypothetical protein [Thermococcus profundus]ASJ02610.1 hypothetical protein A3L09_04715 [Thermococcus profundus]